MAKRGQKEFILENTTRCANSEKPEVYLLNLKQIKVDGQETGKLEFGSPNELVPEKTIMLLGATGSGKTTLINGMINYIFGIQWKDGFRVRLIPEEEKAADQAKSQTPCVTSYTIHHQKWFKVPYTLTIVDTPGFGDTAGIERDKEIAGQIEKFFRTEGDGGLDHITAIGFVVQSSLARLTSAQRYIFDSILSLFGKDIEDNFVPLLTFADGQNPQALAALKVANIKEEKYFKFNNSALFETPTEAVAAPDREGSVESDSDEDDFGRIFWKMGNKSFKSCFEYVQTMPEKSLFLTKELMEERETLQAQVDGINKEVEGCVIKINQLAIELKVLKDRKGDLDKQPDFTYTVQERKKILQEIPGIWNKANNCKNCRMTCHFPCTYAMGSLRRFCATIRFIKGTCTVCPGECSWRDHETSKKQYVYEIITVIKTYEELKKRYQENLEGRKLTQENVVNYLTEDIKNMHKEVLSKCLQARKCIARIREIALKPNPLSTAEYVDMLIEGERKDQKDGYKDRIKQLKEVKKTSEILDQMTEEGYDPMKDHTETITKVIEKYKETAQDGEKCIFM